MVTQEQIAKKLGLSRQLVTFALAGYPQVSAKSRKRILAAAEEMGYRPNPHALALKQKRTGVIALWIPDQISSHYSHVARELNRLVKRDRQELIISEVGVTEAKQIFSHVPVDGVIAVDAPDQVKAYRKTSHSRSVPIVSMGACKSEAADSVLVDLKAGTKAAMEHLLSAGFRRIAHATFMAEGELNADRRSVYAASMIEAGLKPEFMQYPLTDRQYPVARQLIQEYIRQQGCPEAIFCHSDDVALGIYRGLCDQKIRIPQQVALVGCDGIEVVEYLECPLTTLVQPVSEMCAAAWGFLTRRLDEPEMKKQSLVLKPQLVVRESSLRAH